MSADVHFPSRRTMKAPSRHSQTSTEPGPTPSCRRTSAGTEICPCAVTLDWMLLIKVHYPGNATRSIDVACPARPGALDRGSFDFRAIPTAKARSSFATASRSRPATRSSSPSDTWPRYPRDLAHNLVLAHGTCNSRKSDLLGGEPYLERWAEFVSDHDADLLQVGAEAGLLVDRATSVAVAGTIQALATESCGLGNALTSPRNPSRCDAVATTRRARVDPFNETPNT